jgi:hypothetical protein
MIHDSILVKTAEEVHLFRDPNINKMCAKMVSVSSVKQNYGNIYIQIFEQDFLEGSDHLEKKKYCVLL